MNPSAERPRRLIRFAAFAAAVVLAVGLAGWVTLRVVDDLRVAITEPPRLTPIGTDPKQPRFEVRAEHVVTFVNAGRRSIAVPSMALIVVDGPANATCDQIGEVTMGGAWLDYEFEPVVLARGQMAVRTIKAKPAAGDKVPIFEPMFGNEELAKLRVLSCAVFRIVTRNAVVERRVHLGDVVFDADGRGGVGAHRKIALQTLLRRRAAFAIR